MEDNVGRWQRDDIELGEGKVINCVSSQDVDHNSADMSYQSPSCIEMDQPITYKNLILMLCQGPIVCTVMDTNR